MSRRPPKPEVEFGNDSFLDVICNVVGVLIILILVAGTEVSKAPVTPEMLALYAKAVGTESEVVKEAPGEPVIVPAAPSIELTPPGKAKPVAPPPIPLSANLVQERMKLEGEIEVSESEMKLSEKRLRELSDLIRRATERVEESERTVATERNQAEKLREQLQSLSSILEEQKQQVVLLRTTVSKTENEKSPVKPIKHRVTPLSREVGGKEVHFRLLQNRVAMVPVEELADRLKPQIERQKEMLIKYRRQEGQVGPVNGFSMKYAVERDPLPLAAEFRGGQSMVKISVTGWEIVAEPDLQTETAEQALKRGSAFIRAVNMADVDATLTFWVYPDSFGIYRKLRDFAYEEGFQVAGRPIPNGVPISGSPQGSKSAGQ